MEKVRFEAFNVEELRVLRRACYEAGAAFGDPGHTAAERATLDDLAVEILGELKKKEAAAARQKREEPLEKTVAKAVEDSVKDVVGKLPFAPKISQSPAPQKERVAQRSDILAKAKPVQPAESAHRAPEPPAAAKFTGFLYVRCEKCGQERGFCAKTPVSSCYCRECGGKTELKNMRQVKIWCECGSSYRYHTNIQDAAFDMPCLNCESPVALEWNENKNRYQPMNSEPPKARRGRK